MNWISNSVFSVHLCTKSELPYPVFLLERCELKLIDHLAWFRQTRLVLCFARSLTKKNSLDFRTILQQIGGDFLMASPQQEPFVAVLPSWLLSWVTRPHVRLLKHLTVIQSAHRSLECRWNGFWCSPKHYPSCWHHDRYIYAYETNSIAIIILFLCSNLNNYEVILKLYKFSICSDHSCAWEQFPMMNSCP